MIAIFGDIHLNKRIWTKKQDITDDAVTSLIQATEICLKNGYHAVFLGDQFDTNYPPVEMVQAWYDSMSRFQKAGLKVFTIDGNHDPGQQKTDNQDQRSWTAVHPWVQHIDFQVVSFNGIKFVGYDFRPASTAAMITDHLNSVEVDFAFIHQFPKQYGLINLEGVWDIDLDTVDQPVTVFCGHIHNNYEADLFNGGKLIVVGSTNPRSLPEGLQKYYYVIDSNKSVHKHELVYRKIYTFNFEDCKDQEAELAKLVKACNWSYPSEEYLHPIAKPIVAIRYSSTDVELRAKLDTITSNVHTFYMPQFNKKQVADSFDIAKKAISLSSYLSDTIADEKLKLLALRILDSPELADEYLTDYETQINQVATTKE